MLLSREKLSKVGEGTYAVVYRGGLISALATQLLMRLIVAQGGK